MKHLAIVIPCYNEEAVLPTTLGRILELKRSMIDEGLISAASTVVCVDDGSRDNTWKLIEQAATADASVHGIKLSRNHGHQNALLAGLLTVEGDAVVSVDADLQDDIVAIREMVVQYNQGAQIVYGVRRSRDTDTYFKRWTAIGFYRLMRALGIDIVFNHADYRLMGRAAIDALKQYGEVNLFLRGIIPQLGFATARVYCDRSERFAGNSKYSLRKMLSLAWNGLTSFSFAPLRWITLLGSLVSVFSFSLGSWVLVRSLFFGDITPGWASTVIPIYFLGGIQLLSVGIIGEYIGKIYLETKRRPRFIIERIL